MEVDQGTTLLAPLLLVLFLFNGALDVCILLCLRLSQQQKATQRQIQEKEAAQANLQHVTAQFKVCGMCGAMSNASVRSITVSSLCWTCVVVFKARASYPKLVWLEGQHEWLMARIRGELRTAYTKTPSQQGTQTVTVTSQIQHHAHNLTTEPFSRCHGVQNLKQSSTPSSAACKTAFATAVSVTAATSDVFPSLRKLHPVQPRTQTPHMPPQIQPHALLACLPPYNVATALPPHR